MAGWNTYGNINGLSVSGASQQTANQDNLRYAGVDASRQLVKTDMGRLQTHRDNIYTAARQTAVAPALIAAIASRESRAGNCLDASGCGDHGKAYGIMQIDLGTGGIPPARVKGCGPTSAEHISMAIQDNFLGKIKAVQRRFPNWPKDQQLQGAVAAYNMGEGNVGTTQSTIDERTTGRDYSNDVIARAQYLSANGWN